MAIAKKGPVRRAVKAVKNAAEEFVAKPAAKLVDTLRKKRVTRLKKRATRINARADKIAARGTAARSRAKAAR